MEDPSLEANCEPKFDEKVTCIIIVCWMAFLQVSFFIIFEWSQASQFMLFCSAQLAWSVVIHFRIKFSQLLGEKAFLVTIGPLCGSLSESIWGTVGAKLTANNANCWLWRIGKLMHKKTEWKSDDEFQEIRCSVLWSLQRTWKELVVGTCWLAGWLAGRLDRPVRDSTGAWRHSVGSLIIQYGLIKDENTME